MKAAVVCDFEYFSFACLAPRFWLQLGVKHRQGAANMAGAGMRDGGGGALIPRP